MGNFVLEDTVFILMIAISPVDVILSQTIVPSTPHDLQVSQTIPRTQQRSQIALPAQGMIEFRDALTDLLEEYGIDDQGTCVSG